MISLQMPFRIERWEESHHKMGHAKFEVRELTEKKKDSLTMKTMFCGMLLAMSLGPIVLMEVDPDIQFARDLSYSLAGGTFGAGICFCVFLMDNFRSMARHSMGNLLIAGAFGPPTAYWIAERLGMPVTPGLIFATSAALGTGGVFFLKVGGPAILNVLPSVIRKWSGVPEPSPPNPPTAG